MNVPDKLRSILPLNKTVTWLNQLRDCVISNTIVTDGLTMRKKVTPAGTVLQAIGRGGGAMGGGSSSYDGMFAVSQKDTYTITVKSGTIECGTQGFATSTDTDVLLADGVNYIYAEVVYNIGGYFVATIKTQLNIKPVSIDGTYRSIIALVTTGTDGIDTIEQTQYGVLKISGVII